MLKGRRRPISNTLKEGGEEEEGGEFHPSAVDTEIPDAEISGSSIAIKKIRQSFVNFAIAIESEALCQDCRIENHSTNHIFICNSNTTNLTTRSLWDQLREAVALLASIASFSNLPDPGTPPPLTQTDRQTYRQTDIC